ncbi:hypothetical protein HMPREF9074_08044 [Capnocytophaga sp. oral taxon 329 str. F0087]|nr:hypothetical protein HMPREF9074_08044 [Capnocytophaga sp. oral taxon 329 str. F0087]
MSICRFADLPICRFVNLMIFIETSPLHILRYASSRTSFKGGAHTRT